MIKDVLNVHTVHMKQNYQELKIVFGVGNHIQ